MSAIAQNTLHPEFDLSGIITGRTAARKTTTRHGLKINSDGTCPMPGCTWKHHDVTKTSTFQMHVTRKHQVAIGIPMHTYMCGDCHRIFDSRSILNNHQRREHKTTKPHHCPDPDCTYQNPTPAQVMTHYVTKHLKISEKECTTPEGRCIHCNEDRSGKKGNKYHLAKCMGIGDKVKEYNARLDN